MSTIKFLQGDCLEWMNKISKKGKVVDVVLTSPPYNTSRPNKSDSSLKNHEGRYKVYDDIKTGEEYCDWCVNIFNHIDTILKPNGVVLWNVSYGTDATVNTEGIGLMWNSISDIIRNTNFTVADKIVWKKKSALPNNVSPNKLTRICMEITDNQFVDVLYDCVNSLQDMMPIKIIHDREAWWDLDGESET